MTNRTWVGGGNNQASNPNDWSPIGAPQPGDSLAITQGVMNVSGNDLAGDKLSVAGPSSPFPFVANLPPDIVINSRAAARLDLSITHGRINIDAHGTVFLSAVIGGANVNFSGGSIHFIGSDTFTASRETFNDNLVGSATVTLAGGSVSGERMEINGAVAGGLTFLIGGSNAGLQIDHPREFHGTLDLPGAPGGTFADLVGLANVDHWSYAHDVLSMYDAQGKVVDKVHVISDVSSSSVHGLPVSHTAAGDVLVSAGSNFHGVFA